MTTKNNNNKIYATISIFIRFTFRCCQYVSFVCLNAENTYVFVHLDAENMSVLYVLVPVKP